MSIWLLWMCALMALAHLLSIMLSVGEYPWALRSDKDGIQFVDVCHKHILHVVE